MPATQHPGTDRQLAEVVNSNSGPAARSETVSNSGTASRYEESLADRDKAPERTEPSVREDNQLAGLPPDSGYGPSLWTGELDTRRYTRAEERRVGYTHSASKHVRLSEPTTKKLNEDRLGRYYQRRPCSLTTLDSDDIRFMRIFAGIPWKGDVIPQWQWGNRKRVFSGFRTLRIRHLRK